MVEQKIWLFASQGHIYEPRKSVNFSDSILVPKNSYKFTLNYIGENLAWLRAGACKVMKSVWMVRFLCDRYVSTIHIISLFKAGDYST